MDELKNRVIEDGTILEGNILKVDSFLNHQIDIHLMQDVGKEFYRLFKDKNITKIFTIEASGIAIASFTAQAFDVPVLFAKKSKSTNLGNDVYISKVYSYTHNREYTITVSKKYLNKNDRILIVDDFLANGLAIQGLIDIADQANAQVEGIGVCIEKTYQEGGKRIRNLGYSVESLVKIKNMENGRIEFED